MMSITHNLMAMNAGRLLRTTNKSKAKSTEKLSSGYKINRAADDAAGLAISEKMRRQIRGLHQGAENIQDGVGYVQVADGALHEAQDILQRINELSVKAANGTNSEEDRSYIDQEVQALKAELTRIFGTTSFNERLIWKSADTEQVDGLDPERELIGWTTAQAVWFNNTSEYIDITNDNCGVIPYNSYTMHADAEKGVWVSWMGYDGNDYETEAVSWEKLKEDNYTFEMSDYFGDKTDNKLYDADGDPVFKHQISFGVHAKATLDDIITCIDDRTISSDESAYMTGKYENAAGGELADGDVQIYSSSLYYHAAYASNHNTGTGDSSSSQNVRDFDAGDDAFLEPRDAAGNPVQNQVPPAGHGNLTSRPGAVTVDDARDSNEGWEFSFYMDGIGKVTAWSSSVSYWATSDYDPDDENEYWQWEGRWEGTGANQHWNPHYRKASIERNVSTHGTGTLGDVMEALTGRKGSGSPGLLTYANGGHADGGGTIEIHFNITSAEEFAYGKNASSNRVGEIIFHIDVSSSDTEETILQKIQNAFNENTILDFHSASGSSDSGWIGTPSARYHHINVDPIYRDEVDPDDVPDVPADLPKDVPLCDFFVQAGPEAGMHIDISYEALDLETLGLKFTNTLTVKDASRAINSVKRGLEIISHQRSTFGAYQNRLEHAYNINLNSEENTQYAESQIRDTDIAEESVRNANYNILLQAGTSMLTQANQQPNFVLQLLQ